MSDRFSTTISDSDWFLLDFAESPGDTSTIALTRAVSGLSRKEAYAIRTSRTSLLSVTDPYVDGEKWAGTWAIKGTGIKPVNEGSDAGSFMYFERIQYGLFSACIAENQIYGRSQSEAYEQNEYAWMHYLWQIHDESKQWYNIPEAYIEEVFGYMREFHTNVADYRSAEATFHYETLPEAWRGNYYDYGEAIIKSIDYSNKGGTFDDGFSVDAKLVECRDGVFRYMRQIGKVYGYGPAKIKLTTGSFYRLVVESDGTYTPLYTELVYDAYTLTLVELTLPTISRCYTEPANDGTYRLTRSLRSWSSDYQLRTRSLKYAGLVTVQGLPFEGDTTLDLAGFLDETELIHQHSRFIIGGDTYRVLADATAEAGAVTVSVTPEVTATTESLCDDRVGEVMATFLAMR